MSEAFSLNGAHLLRVFYPMIPKAFPNRTPSGTKQSDNQAMVKILSIMTKSHRVSPAGKRRHPGSKWVASTSRKSQLSVSQFRFRASFFSRSSLLHLSLCQDAPSFLSLSPSVPGHKKPPPLQSHRRAGSKLYFPSSSHIFHTVRIVFSFPRSSEIPFLTPKLGCPTTMFSKSPNSFPFLSSVFSSSPWYPFIASHPESSTFLPLFIFKYIFFLFSSLLPTTHILSEGGISEKFNRNPSKAASPQETRSLQFRKADRPLLPVIAQPLFPRLADNLTKLFV